ncbi:hypothetical protein BOW55_06000 [Flavobacterium sp. YO12]|nr:hypothetical protein BOW55_06000 [Flavobacterium sp. YO12]
MEVLLHADLADLTDFFSFKSRSARQSCHFDPEALGEKFSQVTRKRLVIYLSGFREFYNTFSVLIVSNNEKKSYFSLTTL